VKKKTKKVKRTIPEGRVRDSLRYALRAIREARNAQREGNEKKEKFFLDAARDHVKNLL
jgi:hypothetical protein